MGHDMELQKLEQFVDKLLKKYSDLRSEKAKLEQVVLSKEQEIKMYKEKLENIDNERNEISSRVSKLIDRIETWEAGLDQEEIFEGETPVDAEEDMAKPAPEQSADRHGQKRAEAEEGRVQHKLFSMS